MGLLRRRRTPVSAEKSPRRNRRVRPKEVETTAPEVPRPSPKARWRGGIERARALLRHLRRPAEVILRVSVVLAVGVGAIAVGRLVERHVRTSPSFAVTEIELDGHVRLTESEILARAGLLRGNNIFDVAPEEARRRLEQHPWVASATVRRRLPGSYSVEVRERRPVALLALGDVFLVADDGSVFKRVDDGDPVDLPVITGIDRERFTRNRAFRTSVLLEAVALLSDYDDAGLSRREPIEEVHVEADDGLSLYIGDDPTLVRLGHGPFRSKLRRLRTVLDELGSRGASPVYVYLDNERRPDRVTVRVREAADEVATPASDEAPSEPPTATAVTGA